MRGFYSLSILLCLLFTSNKILGANFTITYTANTNNTNWTATGWTIACDPAMNATQCTNFRNNNTAPRAGTSYNLTGTGIGGGDNLTIQIIIPNGTTIILNTNLTFTDSNRLLNQLVVNGNLVNVTSPSVSYNSLTFNGVFNGGACSNTNANIIVGSSGKIDRIQNLTVDKSCNVFNGPVFLNGNLAQSNNSTLNINNYFQVRGNWDSNQGNVNSNGAGFLDVRGCFTYDGSLSNLTVTYCINGLGGCTNDPGATSKANHDCTGTLLPISIFGFSGKVLDNQSVLLSWQLVNDNDIRSFEIERASDDLSFEKIATMDATKANNKSYSYQDNTLEKALQYYRIKEIRQDGKYFYTSVIVIHQKDFIQCKVFPNPSDGKKIQLTTVNLEGNVKIEIFNMFNQLVYATNWESKPEDETKIFLPNLSSGAYILYLKTNVKYQKQFKLIIN
jgi:hypothetical protein